MSRRSRLVLVGLVLLSATLLACQGILGISDFAGIEPPADATTADAESDGSPPNDTGTPPILSCPIIPLSDAGPVPDEEQDGSWPVFAIRKVSFTKVVGFDLDCRNTQNDADLPCKGSPNDDPGGIDVSYNNWAKHIPGTDTVGSIVTDRIQTGVEAMLIQVSAVPSTPTLPRNASGIQIGIARSTGLSKRGCDMPYYVDGGEAGIPVWDGCDWWKRAPFSLNLSSKAWIQDGTLVGQFDDPTPLVLTLDGISITVHEAVLIAKLGTESTDDGGANPVPSLVSGTIVGRVRASDAIQAAARYELKSGAGPICKTALFPTLDTICGFRDLPSAGRGSANATCDSLSFALSFDAVSARIYGDTPADDAGDPCADVPIDASCGAN